MECEENSAASVADFRPRARPAPRAGGGRAPRGGQKNLQTYLYTKQHN
jgi:hypothetical protein